MRFERGVQGHAEEKFIVYTKFLDVCCKSGRSIYNCQDFRTIIGDRLLKL
jgi:hypothetical protein